MADAAPDQPIRDAATLVIVDRSGSEPRVLMGRRRPDQVFLPNVFVFPGGRVDHADAAAPSADDLPGAEAALLAIPRDGHQPYAPAFVRSLALAAVRETFEETGLAVGMRANAADASAGVASDGWTQFLATGVVPRLSALKFFLRAITPRARPRRYDTRFFLVDADAIAWRGQPIDEELSEIAWFSLRAMQALELPRVTHVVVKELEHILAHGLAPVSERRVPFLFEHDGVRHRAELSLAPARS